MLQTIREQIRNNKYTLKGIMTDHVLTVHPQTTLKDIAHLFLRYRISGVPVVDDQKKIVGIITATDLFDLLKMVIRDSGAEHVFESGYMLTANDIMVREVMTIHEDTPLEDVIDVMISKNIHTLPVVRDTDVVGIVGRRDILNAVFQGFMAQQSE